MLQAYADKSREITEIKKDKYGLYLISELGILRISPRSEGCIRISYTQRGSFLDREKPGVLPGDVYEDWTYRVKEDTIEIATDTCTIEVNKKEASCRYYDNKGKLLLKERDRESRVLEECQSYRLLPGALVKTEKIQTPDGIKEVVREAPREPGDLLYHTRLYLEWQDGEALYGLGQQEEGVLNLRGHMVYLHQANRKIAVPMLVSTLGYGILTDTYSPMIFSDTEFGSYLYTEADDEMDYYFMVGENMDEVVSRYRALTGKVSLPPKWAFGYLQSQERYESAEELIRVAGEYRSRGLGLDAIILDWCSWEDGMWGQKSFDPLRFPDPLQMTEKLHEKDVHFMISVWPNMDEKCGNYQEMKESDLILPASSIYNAYSMEGRKLYWKQADRGLFQYGVDGWWCDSSEPLTPEWSHKERVEPAVMYHEYNKSASDVLPSWAANAYGLMHARALYEGQRTATKGIGSEKRVVNLTRSAYTGQQRYGTILWSGDTDATWDTLKKQIAAGLNFSASGLPFWTVDIGAFFVKNGNFWYWKGDYDDTLNDGGYRELYVRWFQWGAFLPVFRGHGTDCRREMWMFEDSEESAVCWEKNLFYNALVDSNRLRYQLMPYIYSMAGLCWLKDGSMMKPLAFDFTSDDKVFDIRDQYMFGDAFMVCPVTSPMYFEKNSVPLEATSYTREVYLPEGCGWYDFWTEEYYEGGQWITAEAPISKIPLFVKAGSIVPMTEAGDRVSEKEEIVMNVYSGADCEYVFYRDAGDGYDYENGGYECSTLKWSEREGILTCDHNLTYEIRIKKRR